jgi:glycine/D-amino acid oxidase-like deaminating enzyme
MRLALGSTVSDVKFFSWTPVAALGENADGTISVNCGDRGIITARNVIVGTSAYTHHILPELKSM